MTGWLGALLHPLGYIQRFVRILKCIFTWLRGSANCPWKCWFCLQLAEKKCVQCVVCLDNGFFLFALTSLLYPIAAKLSKKAGWKKIHPHLTLRVCLGTN